MMLPIDIRPAHLWMGSTFPFYASANLAIAIAQASLIGPVYLSLAWQGAWLDLLAEAARQSEKAARDK